MSLLLGCIADDFTGATDLANTLVRQGMRTVQLIGVPETDFSAIDADAVVIALKSRTIAASEAVEQSIDALRWLQRAGCRQFFFKYCSTFDSTDEGNIGPVAEALLDALNEPLTIACPAFPEAGRTVFKGHLFVGDTLLSESGMKNHPLTPMTDANLVRVLDRQTRGRVGLIPYDVVRRGRDAICDALQNLRRHRFAFAVVDAIHDAHLLDIGRAVPDMRLVTGGSGAVMGLPENFRRRGLLEERGRADILPPVAGKAAVLSGSCSAVSRGQVQWMQRTHPSFKLDIAAIDENRDRAIEGALFWALPRVEKEAVLIYTSDTPESVDAVQARLGRDHAGRLAEEALAEIACRLVEGGVRRLIVAGGETSGAVVKALNIKGLRIGPQIDPGIPWTVSLGNDPLALALKSGNFGTPDFFKKAFDMLSRSNPAG